MSYEHYELSIKDTEENDSVLLYFCIFILLIFQNKFVLFVSRNKCSKFKSIAMRVKIKQKSEEQSLVYKMRVPKV